VGLALEPEFVAALTGEVEAEIDVREDGQRFMEVYLPLKRAAGDEVVAALELYDDVSHFETEVQQALQQALVLPVVMLLALSGVPWLIIAKADRIIAQQTRRLMAIRHNMELYISPLAVAAILQAVSQQTELFRGEGAGLGRFYRGGDGDVQGGGEKRGAARAAALVGATTLIRR